MMEMEKKFNGAVLMSTESRQPLNIPLNYPHGCTDEQILLALQAINTELLRRGANVNDVLQLGPLITIGQTELQARIANRSSQELQTAIGTFKSSSNKASLVLIVLTGVLVVLTFVLALRL